MFRLPFWRVRCLIGSLEALRGKPVIDLLANLVPLKAIALLNLAFELLATSIGDYEVISSEPFRPSFGRKKDCVVRQRRTFVRVPLKRKPLVMSAGRCKQFDQPLVEIDHYGELLTGCPTDHWQMATSSRRLWV